MRVENKNDNMVQPEECDWCGAMGVELERFYRFGPRHNVAWLCPYCRNDFCRGENNVVKSVSAMFNVLEKRIKREYTSKREVK